ncbi:hypothetical protein IMG5_019300, partial [Ichthyophthirius multifiliis]
STLNQQLNDSDIKNIEPVQIQLDDVILTGWPNQPLEVTFNPEIYDIYSIKLIQKLQNGQQKEEQELDNEAIFQSRDLKDLGGCRTFQTKAAVEPVFKTTTNFQGNNMYERFEEVITFDTYKKMYIVSNSFQVYSLYYSESTQFEIDNASINYDPDSSFQQVLNIPKELTSPDTKIIAKMSAIQHDKYGYIFCKFGAVRFSASSINYLSRNDFILQESFIKRTEIFSVYKDHNNYIYAATSEGIDIYTLDEKFTLKFLKSLTTVQLRQYHQVQKMDIRKIQIVKQGDNELILLLENQFGIHVLQNINNNAPWAYKYFIFLRRIQNFDATGFTLAAVLSTKNYQFGVEIFFDQQNYYQNQQIYYFQHKKLYYFFKKVLKMMSQKQVVLNLILIAGLEFG